MTRIGRSRADQTARAAAGETTEVRTDRAIRCAESGPGDEGIPRNTPPLRLRELTIVITGSYSTFLMSKAIAVVSRFTSDTVQRPPTVDLRR